MQANVGDGWQTETNDVRTSGPRVSVFLDLPNLETSAREQGVRFEPKLLRAMAERHGRVVRARVYGYAPTAKPVSRGVVQAVRAGFEFVPRVVVDDGTRDIDTQMTADIVDAALSGEADLFVIGSGDADFLPALRVVKRKGGRALVVAVEGSCSGLLIAEADAAVVLKAEEPQIPEIRAPVAGEQPSVSSELVAVRVATEDQAALVAEGFLEADGVPAQAGGNGRTSL